MQQQYKETTAMLQGIGTRAGLNFAAFSKPFGMGAKRILSGKNPLRMISTGLGALLLLGGTAHAAIIAATAFNSATAASIEAGQGPVVSYTNQNLSSSLTASLPGTTVTTTTDPNFALITASSSSSAFTTNQSSGLSYLRYYYDVSGVTGPAAVDISYNIFASSTSMGHSSAEVVVDQYDAEYFQELPVYSDSIESVGAGPSQSSTETYLSTVLPGGPNEITIDASAGTLTGPSSAYAYADPYIYIDPAYLAANPGATLEISSGIGNIAPTTTSAAPEPSTWILMIAGIGGIGLRLRRAKQAMAFRLKDAVSA